MHKPLAKTLLQVTLDTYLKVISSQYWLIFGFESGGAESIYFEIWGGRRLTICSYKDYVTYHYDNWRSERSERRHIQVMTIEICDIYI